MWPYLQPYLCMETTSNVPYSPQVLYLTLPTNILLILSVASIAIAWHGLILRNERITNRPYLRLDKAVWNYFILVFVFQIASKFPVFSNYIKADNIQEQPSIRLSFEIIFLVCFLPKIIRFSLMLPMQALERGTITKDFLPITNGNLWRIFVGSMLCWLPISIISALIQQDCRNDLIGVTTYTISAFLNILFALPVMLTFLSLSYQHFFEKNKG